MERDDALRSVRAFSPTGNEAADVRALDALIGQLGSHIADMDVRRELIAIFERNPAADLGAPGPIVHALEQRPIDEHVALLAESLCRQATMMTVWMAERCFRSNLNTDSRQALLAALRTAAERDPPGEVATAIGEALENYGKEEG